MWSVASPIMHLMHPMSSCLIELAKANEETICLKKCWLGVLKSVDEKISSACD